MAGLLAIAAADRLELGEVALGLLDRALLEQGFPFARDRGEVVRIALERLAVIANRLALEARLARRIGEVEVDRGVRRIDRQGRFEAVDRRLHFPRSQFAAAFRNERRGARIGCPVGTVADARCYRHREREAEGSRGITHHELLERGPWGSAVFIHLNGKLSWLF